jgi:type II secretory pathway pseudopilin PulG
MKTIALVIVALLTGVAVTRFATSSAAQSIQEQIVAKEREELDALKSGRLDVFAGLIADEAIFLNQHGPSPKAEVVQHVADFKLLEYTMEDIRFVPVAEKTGLIIYKLTQKGSSGGREFTSKANVSALWTERQGKWLCLFSQETPAKK